MIKRLTLATLLALTSLPALAATQDEVLTASILPGWRAANGTHMAALHLQLAPEWKTYWRAPGDAGIPPMFDWSASANVQSVSVHWPRPEVFHVNGMQTIGYHAELVLPLEITPIDPALPITLRATIDLGVCNEICMPAALDLTANLAADLPAPGTANALIDAALLARPATGAEAGLTLISCKVEAIADGLRVTAHLQLPPTGAGEIVVMEPGQSAIWVSEAQVTRADGMLTAIADLVPASGAPFTLDHSALVVTVLGKDRAVEIAGCPAP
ncbi:MAG: protein-disulfide reductase DsbD domain-containing protein [Paracoccaceae bacterium]